MDVDTLDPPNPGYLETTGLSPPLKVTKIPKQPPLATEAASLETTSEARSLLVRQRTLAPSDKASEQQLRSKFSLVRLRNSLDVEAGSFTLHEVAATVNAILWQDVLPSAQVFRAVLLHAGGLSLEELWRHKFDAKLQRRQSSRFRRPKPATSLHPEWLDQAIRRGNLEYLHLLCQMGVEQAQLNHALGTALGRHAFEAAVVLLKYGADGSAHKATIREYFVNGNDLGLARLLVAAPDGAMSINAWRHCLDPRVLRCPSILLVCVAHIPKIISANLFLASVETQNLEIATVLLAYAASSTISLDVCGSASNHVCTVSDIAIRHALFGLLSKAGLLVDNDDIRQELLRSVTFHHLAIVQTLVHAGVTVDSLDHNAFRWAVQNKDFEIVELLGDGRCTSSIAQVLLWMPHDASESERLHLISILEARRLSRGSMDMCLKLAVRQKHPRLVELLLDRGASVESEGGSALRHALRLADLDTLEVMLRNECSVEVMTACIPIALYIAPKPLRLSAMRMLTTKSVSRQALGAALHMLMSESEQLDADLIELMLTHGAPVEGFDNGAESCVVLAARKADLRVTKMLTNFEARKDVLSDALPLVYSLIHRGSTTSEVLAVLELLCTKGAGGPPMDETLLAAVLDSHIDVAHLMIQNGANANHEDGAAFGAAFALGDSKILQLLCAATPPDQRSVEETVLSMVTASEECSIAALEVFLSSSGSSAAALDSLWPTLAPILPSRMSQLLPCFIRHGLNINHGQGDILRFAIEHEDYVLLQEILAANPSISSLKHAYRAAGKISTRAAKLQTMSALLRQADYTEIGQTKSLSDETEAALAGDLGGLVLILNHKASVDLNDGHSVCRAAATNDTRVLDMLLLCNPTMDTLTRACLEVAGGTLTPKPRAVILRRLLAASDRVLIRNASTVLALSIRRLPHHTQLPILLLEHGAQPDFDTLCLAVSLSPLKLVQALLASCTSADMAEKVFKDARRSRMKPARRYQIYTCLLTKSLSSDDITLALLDYIAADKTGGTDVLKLLLAHGADVGAAGGKAFRLAIAAGSPDVTKLLIQYIPDDTTASSAFDVVRAAQFESPSLRWQIYQSSLQHWNVSPLLLDQALRDCVEEDTPNVAVIQLLISKGADPHQHKASAFLSAATAGNEALFRVLSKHGNLDIVLRTLIARLDSAHAAARWLLVMLEELPSGSRIQDNGLLLDCLRRYPTSSTLLELLLANGALPRAFRSRSVQPSGPPEPTPLLLCAFSLKPRVHTSHLSLLLQYAGKAAGTYTTPETGVSVAFFCLLDNDRLPLLAKMLHLWGPELESYEVPRQTFAVMSSNREMSAAQLETFVLPDRLPLRLAALYLGNLGAYHLLSKRQPVDDGTLHMAAFMALPRLVEHLLETHDPDLKEEDFDFWIPLALACDAKELPWCKIANEEADFNTRLAETMKLLIPSTSLDWRHRGKTVLHIALENGLEATIALTDALVTKVDKSLIARHTYKDRAGREYSPVEYVEELMGKTRTEKEALVVRLKEVGLGSSS